MKPSLALASLVAAAAVTAPVLAQPAAPPAAPGQTVIVIQQPGAGQPPPGYAPAAPGYAPAAPGYPPPAYYPQPAYSTAPAILDYEDGDPVPPGYHKSSHARKGLVIGGSVLFGTTYLLTLSVAGIGQLVNDVYPKGSKDFGPLLIPVAGPFVGLATTQPSSGGAFGLALLGLMQAGGVAMFIAGFAAPKTRLVRDGKNPGPTFAVLPTSFGPSSAGLGLVGSM
jgi:hypothetical protein